MTDGSLSYALSLADKGFSSTLGKADAEVKRFDATTRGAGTGAAGMAGGLGRIAGAANLLLGPVGGAAAVAYNAARAFTAFADQEALIKGLAAVTKEAGPLALQIDRLKDVAKLPGLGFEEAVKGSVRLQAAGLSAGEAEAALKAFGNALATVGAGKAELDGVTLALTQIASKGKISAEEINQLNERLPQVRAAMQAAFGTSQSDAIEALGISAKEFINGLTTEFAKLKQVSAGAKNDIENLGDAWKELKAGIGGLLAPVLQPMVQSFSSLATLGTQNVGEFRWMGAEIADILDGAEAWHTQQTAVTAEISASADELGRAADEAERAEAAVTNTIDLSKQRVQAKNAKALVAIREKRAQRTGQVMADLQRDDRSKLPLVDQIREVEQQLNRVLGGRSFEELQQRIKDLLKAGGDNNLELADNLAAVLAKARLVRNELDDLRRESDQISQRGPEFVGPPKPEPPPAEPTARREIASDSAPSASAAPSRRIRSFGKAESAIRQFDRMSAADKARSGGFGQFLTGMNRRGLNLRDFEGLRDDGRLDQARKARVEAAILSIAQHIKKVTSE